jgi:hypothetical protein
VQVLGDSETFGGMADCTCDISRHKSWTQVCRGVFVARLSPHPLDI